MKINKNKKGFTLTELIIVIVIIGILAAVLIPSLSSYIKKAKVSKGEQNARNMTSLIVGEVLLNDKEFLMPDEVVEIVGKSGYDLISELEEYAYWYDTEHNRIEYVKIADAMNSVSAATSTPRSRVECLSEARPNWFYIDQTPNAIKEAIDGVNNLYKNAKEQAGITGTPTVEGDYQNILNRMETKFNELVNNLEKMKFLNKSKNSQVKNDIVNYVKSFSVDKTVYYTEDGMFNTILYAKRNTTAGFTDGSTALTPEKPNEATALVFEHGVITKGVKELKLPDDFKNLGIIIDAPILIPTTVTRVNMALSTLIKGQVLVVASNLDSVDNLGHKNGTVEVGNLATLNLITYNALPYTLNYDKRAYRFVSGVVFVIDAKDELYVDSRDIVWLCKAVTSEEESPSPTYRFEKYIPEGYTDEENVYYTYKIKGTKADDNTSTENNTPTKYELEKVINTTEPPFSGPTDFNVENRIEEVLISKYLIPTIQVNQVNFSDFISGGKINGQISMSSVLAPYSVKFSGAMVNSNNVGYKLDNVGYITDILYGIDQLRTVTDATGAITYTMDGNTSAKITVNVPYTANKFVNFSNVKVTVDYKPVYYEYVDSKWLEGQTLRIQTGNKYDGNMSGSNSTLQTGIIRSGELQGNIYDGFTLDVNGIDNYKYCKTEKAEDSESETFIDSSKYENCNQIEITKIQIKDNDGNVLFVRYFR